MLISLHLLSLNARQFWQGGLFRLALSEHGSHSHNFRNLNLYFFSLCNLVLRLVLLYYTLECQIPSETVCFPESPDVSRDEVEGNIRTRGRQTNWFPEGPDIKCSVIFLDFQFNVLQQQQKNTL